MRNWTMRMTVIGPAEPARQLEGHRAPPRQRVLAGPGEMFCALEDREIMEVKWSLVSRQKPDRRQNCMSRQSSVVTNNNALQGSDRLSVTLGG